MNDEYDNAQTDKAMYERLILGTIGPPERLIMPTKPTNPNPKDLIGTNKVPFHLWPEIATALGALALLDGALKYGRSNWRAAGVRASIYYDACRRHLGKWFEGEELDRDSGLPHLAHALACLGILVDALATDRLVDDRMYRGHGFALNLDRLAGDVARLRERAAKQQGVKHWTIEDKA